MATQNNTPSDNPRQSLNLTRINNLLSQLIDELDNLPVGDELYDELIIHVAEFGEKLYGTLLNKPTPAAAEPQPSAVAPLADNERDYWPECDTEQTIIVYDMWHGDLVQVDGVELYVNRAAKCLFGAYGANKIAIRPTCYDWTILTDEDAQEIRNACAEWKR